MKSSALKKFEIFPPEAADRTEEEMLDSFGHKWKFGEEKFKDILCPEGYAPAEITTVDKVPPGAYFTVWGGDPKILLWRVPDGYKRTMHDGSTTGYDGDIMEVNPVSGQRIQPRDEFKYNNIVVTVLKKEDEVENIKDLGGAISEKAIEDSARYEKISKKYNLRTSDQERPKKIYTKNAEPVKAAGTAIKNEKIDYRKIPIGMIEDEEKIEAGELKDGQEFILNGTVYKFKKLNPAGILLDKKYHGVGIIPGKENKGEHISLKSTDIVKIPFPVSQKSEKRDDEIAIEKLYPGDFFTVKEKRKGDEVEIKYLIKKREIVTDPFKNSKKEVVVAMNAQEGDDEFGEEFGFNSSHPVKKI